MGHTHLTLKTKRNIRGDTDIRGPVGQGGLYGELGPTIRIREVMH